VVVTNLGDPLSGWTLTWSYGAGQTVGQAWNATVTQSGSSVTAKNASYNGALATGGTASFGFNGTWTGSNPAPASFAVNGVTCNGSAAPTTGPATSPTAAPNATADITVNTATKYQTIDGFGAAVSIWGSAWSTAETQTLVGLGANQLGLSIVRTGISPVSGEWATQVSALKTAKASGSGVKILASPWTAPAEFKTNNSRINGGSLKTDYYDDYANHLNSFVQYMEGQGVAIDVTSVQNEPDWAPAYDSMTWTGAQLRDFVRDQGAKVQGTRLMVAEAVNLNYGLTDPTLNDAAARNNIGYIGGHLYGTEDAGRLAPYALAAQNGKPVWMTEWNLHAAAGDTSTAWADPGNQAVWNETLDDVMRTVGKAMESNWSAYVWWYGKRFYSFIGDGSAGTTVGAPLKRGFAFSQFAKYVRPGYQRVGLAKSSKASPLEVTAYQGDGKITLVVLNRSATAVSNAVVQAPQNVTKAEEYSTSQTTNAAGQPTTVNGGQVTVDVPARSISTIILTL
jgi:glucuronoarabinoxylan endo-1,4-beta-xylanase